MDPFSKKLLEELEQMQQHTGRILRTMSLPRMMSTDAGGWQPAMDIYEAEDSIFVYAELAGVVAESLKVTVDGQRISISGIRQLPSHKSIACIHQLEIELGAFQRILRITSYNVCYTKLLRFLLLSARCFPICAFVWRKKESWPE